MVPIWLALVVASTSATPGADPSAALRRRANASQPSRSHASQPSRSHALAPTGPAVARRRVGTVTDYDELKDAVDSLAVAPISKSSDDDSATPPQVERWQPTSTSAPRASRRLAQTVSTEAELRNAVNCNPAPCVDEIVVADGTYTLNGHLTVRRTLTIRAANRRQAVLIAGTNARHIHAQFRPGPQADALVKLEGLVFKDAHLTSTTSVDFQDRMLGGSLYFHDVALAYNSYAHVDSKHLWVSIDDCLFKNNVVGTSNPYFNCGWGGCPSTYPTQYGSGGAIFFMYGVRAAIRNSEFKENRAHGRRYSHYLMFTGEGGAIMDRFMVALFIDNCIFDDNHADHYGHHLKISSYGGYTANTDGSESSHTKLNWAQGIAALHLTPANGFPALGALPSFNYQNFVIKNTVFKGDGLLHGLNTNGMVGSNGLPGESTARPGIVSAIAIVPHVVHFYCDLGRWMPQGVDFKGGDVATEGPGCWYKCSAGRYGPTPWIAAAADCPFCEKGHYCPEAVGSMTPCPVGTHMPAPGAAGVTSCVPCAPGTYMDQTARGGSANPYPVVGGVEQVGCTACPAGKFVAGLAESSCDPCPVGGYCGSSGAASAAMAFTPCPAGKYNTGTGASSVSSCTGCPVGKANAVPGSSSAADCTQCLPGSVAPSTGTNVCSLCAAGKYQGEQALVGISMSAACAVYTPEPPSRAAARGMLTSRALFACRCQGDDRLQKLRSWPLLRGRRRVANPVPRRNAPGQDAFRHDFGEPMPRLCQRNLLSSRVAG